jgi:hypothetical protein
MLFLLLLTGSTENQGFKNKMIDYAHQATTAALENTGKHLTWQSNLDWENMIKPKTAIFK